MTLAALLPPSSTPLERAAVDALAVQTDPSIIRRYHNPDTCPVELLPLLAWERHVAEWAGYWRCGLYERVEGGGYNLQRCTR